MKMLYFDCFAGISGDMTLGALLDLGIDEGEFLSELKKLNLHGYELKISRKKKKGIEGTDVDVIIHEHSHEHRDKHSRKHSHEHRNLFDIEQIINNSSLDAKVKGLSKKIFMKVATAEAKVHGISIDEVHFHEVGAIDSIIDIVGTAILINMLECDKIMSSALNVGSGFVKCQHGIMPVPAPATLEILRKANIPFYSNEIQKELTTPTGAAIIAVLAEEFSASKQMIVKSTGYGTGKRELETIPNMLRITLGEIDENKEQALNDQVTVIECNIDNMSGEIAGFVMDELLSTGALDVFYTPIYMKKNRPAVKLTVICSDESVDKLEQLILRETTTIGVRKYKTERTCMNREVINVNTIFGDVRVKVSTYGGIIKAMPEYEDIKKISKRENLALREVLDIVLVETKKGE